MNETFFLFEIRIIFHKKDISLRPQFPNVFQIAFKSIFFSKFDFLNQKTQNSFLSLLTTKGQING
jgi:hypothetical protein